MNGWQCPQCGSPKVALVVELLTCLGCGFQDYLYDYHNAYDNPLTATPARQDISELEDRVCNLESISAERGSIPRKYHDEFQQIHGEIASLRNKVVSRKRDPAPA